MKIIFKLLSSPHRETYFMIGKKLKISPLYVYSYNHGFPEGKNMSIDCLIDRELSRAGALCMNRIRTDEAI